MATQTSQHQEIEPHLPSYIFFSLGSREVYAVSSNKQQIGTISIYQISIGKQSNGGTSDTSQSKKLTWDMLTQQRK
jgi:hypothetical protein